MLVNAGTAIHQSVDAWTTTAQSVIVGSDCLSGAQYRRTFAVPELWRETATKVYGCTFD